MSDGPSVPLRHRAEYALFRAATGACMALGSPGELRAAERIGRTFYHTVRIRRDVVRANLRAAFPERDDAWIRETAAASYAHIARETIVALRYNELGADRIRETATVVGEEPLMEAVRAGGAVLVTAHLGNWEVGLHVMAVRGLPSSAIMQRQKNRLFDAFINTGRGRFGTEVIDRRHAAAGTMRALRRNRAVYFVADQNAGRNGVFVPFFGRPASTHRGPALLALRSGAPLFAVSIRRVADWRYAIRFQRIPVHRETDPEEAVRDATARFTRWLEDEIRKAPEQYFWLHKRWKTPPPEEPDAWETGTLSTV